MSTVEHWYAVALESQKRITQLEAESATSNEVIRRLLDGWKPYLVYGQWRKPDPDEQRPWADVVTQMSDAHRSVLENLPEGEKPNE